MAAILGSDRNSLNFKLDEGSNQLRNFVESTIVSQSGDIDRITKYSLYWNFYEGKHWRRYNETFLSFNYVKTFTNKVINFLLGKDGFTLSIKDNYDRVLEDKEHEKSIETYLNYVWKKNKKMLTIYEMLQMGSVCGDVWMHAQWDNDQKFVKLNTLDSRQCFPEFENGDINKLNKFILRQPLVANENGYKVFCVEYSKDTIRTWFQKDTSTSSEKIDTTSTKNPYGQIPIIHIKNQPNSAGYYSTSDMADTLKINKTYNETAQMVKGIIDYYVTPVTVVTGGTIKSLTKGLGSIWSGLPAEANVFNLGLGEDLGAANEFMKTLKTSMHELSDVPEASIGRLQSISNTSAAALQIQYQPLIEQANLKNHTYGEGLSELHILILQIASIYKDEHPEFSKIKPEVYEVNSPYNIYPNWAYGLPKDKLLMLQQMQVESQLRIGDRNEFMERLGKSNIPDLLKSIDEDYMEFAGMQNAFANVSDGLEPDDPELDTGDDGGKKGAAKKRGAPAKAE